MAKKVTDEQRAAILDQIRADMDTDTGANCRRIATQHGVSADTVSRIAKAAGIEDAFGRTRTEHATRAKQADNRSRRAKLSERLLIKAGQLLDQMDQPHIAFSFGGRDNSYAEHRFEKPPTGDLRNLMTTAAIAIDKHAVIERLDKGTEAETAGSLLGALLDDLQAAHGTTPTE